MYKQDGVVHMMQQCRTELQKKILMNSKREAKMVLSSY